MNFVVSYSNFKKLLLPFKKQDNIYGVVDQVFVSLGNFSIVVLLARFLSLQSFGFYSLYLIAQIFFIGLQLAFVVSPLYTYLPQISESRNKKKYVTSVFYLNFFSSIFFAFLCFGYLLIIEKLNPNLHTSQIAFSSTVAFFLRLLQEYTRRQYFAYGETKNAAINDMVVYCLIGVGILFFYMFDILTINSFFYLYAITNAVGIVNGLWLKYPGRICRKTFWKTWHRHWNFSKWLVGWAILSAIVRDFIVINVGLLLSPVEIGKIRAAERLSGLIGIVIQLLENVLPVKAAFVLYHESKTGLLVYIKKIYMYVFVFITLYLLVFVFFSEWLIVGVFGKSFVGSGYILTGYAFSYSLYLLSIPLIVCLRSYEKTAPIFWGIFVGALLTISSSNLMINQFGIKGAMGTLFISNAAFFLYLLYWTSRYNKKI